MSPIVTPGRTRSRALNRPYFRFFAFFALLMKLACTSGCALSQSQRPAVDGTPRKVGPDALQRLLTGPLPAALTPGFVQVSAHVFTQPGSLVSVFAKTLPSAQPNTFVLAARIPSALLHEPLLIRVSGPIGFYQTLVVPRDQTQTPVDIAAMDDKTTVAAQIYVAARAAQSWPRDADPNILTPIISPEMAHAVRQAANKERTLAAVTQGVVAAVRAWQAIVSDTQLAAAMLQPPPTLVASLALHTQRNSVTSDVDSGALSEARSLAHCVDCPTLSVPLALAAQAGADAWLVYADKLPWALRGQALVDAAALQTHYMLAMVAESNEGASYAATGQAASALELDFDHIRQNASTASPSTTSRNLSLAWQRYTQAVWQNVVADDSHFRADWSDSFARLEAPLAALRMVRQQLNSRVAPAQTAASMAQGYMRVYQATQTASLARPHIARSRLSAALILHAALLVSAR